jgi:hypothetical protein
VTILLAGVAGSGCSILKAASCAPILARLSNELPDCDAGQIDGGTCDVPQSYQDDLQKYAEQGCLSVEVM